MRYDNETSEFVLATGRRFYASCGLLSISLESFGFDVCDGCDGTVSYRGSDKSADPADAPWTPEERAEVADHMIALWQAFKEEK